MLLGALWSLRRALGSLHQLRHEAPPCQAASHPPTLGHNQGVPSASKLGLLPLDTLIYVQAQADPLLVCPTAPVPARSILGMCSWTRAWGAPLRNSLCKTGSGCRSSERPTALQAQSQGEPSWGWMGLPGKAGEGVGGHQPGPRLGRATGCVTELGPARIHLAEQLKGSADNKNESKNTENNHKYLFRSNKPPISGMSHLHNNKVFVLVWFF